MILLSESQHGTNNSASHSCIIFDWPVEAKGSESCQKDVKKLSQTNQNLCPSGNSRMCRIVKSWREILKKKSCTVFEVI